MTDPFRYVINLTDRRDRRRDMEKQLQSVGWEATFSNSTRPSDSGGFESIGARGCFESHLQALRLASTKKTPTIVMEDDLDFSPDLKRKWDQIWNSLQGNDWAIFYPAHQLDAGTAENGIVQLDPGRGVLCAHFVVFNYPYIDRIVRRLEEIYHRPPGHPLGGPMHVDGAYSTIRAQNPDLPTFAYFPALGRQRSSKSDIAPRKLYDRIPALEPVMNFLRKLKSR